MAVDQRPLRGNHGKLFCGIVVEGVEQDTGEQEEVSFPFKAIDAPIDVTCWFPTNGSNHNVHVQPGTHDLTVERLTKRAGAGVEGMCSAKRNLTGEYLPRGQLEGRGLWDSCSVSFWG